MHRAAVVVALLVLLTTLAATQGMPFERPVPGPPHMRHHHELGAWWKNSEVVKELQLTDAQLKQIEQTFLEHRMRLIDLRADLERQELRFHPLVEADQPDEAKVSAQLDAVLAARGRLEKAHAMMMLAIRRVLSLEQWKKLQSIQHRRDHLAPAPHPAHFRVFRPGPGRVELPAPPPAGAPEGPGSGIEAPLPPEDDDSFAAAVEELD